jgi:hypothetical protein
MFGAICEVWLKDNIHLDAASVHFFEASYRDL